MRIGTNTMMGWCLVLSMSCGDNQDTAVGNNPDGAGSGDASTTAQVHAASEGNVSDVGFTEAAPSESGGPVESGVPIESGNPIDAALPDRLVIAGGQAAPTGIGVDATFVYFANRDAGTIVRCPHSGCGSDIPKVVVSGQDAPIALALDVTHLYWVTGWRKGQTGDPPSRPIFRCALPDCAAPSIEPFDRGTYQPYGIAVTASNVYLAAWPSLAICPKTGCATGAMQIGGGPYVSIDPETSYLYAAKFGFQQVVRCPVTGCSPDMPFLADVFPMSVVADAESLFIADFDFFKWQGQPDGGIRTPRLLRCPIAGCAAAGPSVIESGEISPYALAERGDRLYFTNVQQGTVISRRK